MYFAINRPLPDLPDLIGQEVAALRAPHFNVPIHVLALVDGAFDEQFFSQRFRTSLERVSLYQGTVLAALDTAAPYLLRGPADVGKEQAWLERLYEGCDGKPMLSVIASTVDIEAMARHLRPFLVAMTDDSLEWPVRWGDTRVLPNLIAALTETQRDQLLAPVHKWWAADRDGELTSWSGMARTVAADPTFDKLPINDEAFALLVDDAEADAVLTQIEERQPDLLRGQSPAECYGKVKRHLMLASANGIEAAGARRHFSVLALMLKDDFSGHPEVERLFQKTRAGADYVKEVELLSPAFWAATTTTL